ncbi:MULTISPECIES: sensor histidine kinase [Bradyrhizobium]|uniref:sensor histidine kinase n=1 Tax=Bradyrhizobium TaxID=374 RepID=UPI001957588E|nr:histidine kinase dimerization/phosphoacceptor domain -containing protein [Bradyrhizobium canariense]MBM7485940.1 two-component sensor histidine kinase [Bradyrhizobium canariense]
MTAFNTADGPAASSTDSTGRDELGYRLRQQSLLGEFGRAAMQTRDLRMILQKATELCAIGLRAQFAKVLEYEPDEERLMVRAGVGWKENTIDVVSLAADVGSPAGYAYRTGESVISNHLEAETRFRTPQLLTDHGVRRAINVLIEKGAEDQAYFGVLEVDSADAGQFDQADADFLTGFAGLLGIAIERQQADAKLQEALKHQALLTREMSHRVKNSLASVVGLLRVQARNTLSQDVKSALEDASLRVSTIADVHDHLWRSSHVGFIELRDFMTELCKKLRGNVGKHTLNCQADPLLLSADHVVPLGLLINELVSNAIKYAYPDSRGVIEVSARGIEGNLRVEVSDQGKGLPEGFDIDEPRASLGFKVITGMVRQLQGHLTIAKGWKGSRFLIDLPIISHPDRSQPS